MEVGSESCHNLNSRHREQRRAGTRSLEEQTKIYTDWANHYLAKSGHKRMIRDLQQDIADGVLLAEIIQVVANEKIADINSYPESRSQMIENIDACLSFLAAKGVNIKGLCAEEIRSGNLKAILGLFFSLSLYKQQQQHATLKQANDETHRIQTAPVQSARPAQGHYSWCTPNAPACLVHIHEHEQHNGNESRLKTQQDMQSRNSSLCESRKLSVAPIKSNRLPGPSIQPRRSISRRSQSFIHREDPKTQMLTCSQHTDKSTPSQVTVDQESPSSPVPPRSMTDATNTKGWRSKSLNAKHTATSAILSIKQPTSSTLDVPTKVNTQKSILDNLKLYNSRPSSRASSITSLDDPDVLNHDLNETKVSLAHPEAHLGNRQHGMASNSSPSLAFQGITQKTLGRTLVPKLKAAERDKEKVKRNSIDKASKQSSGIEQDRIMEEQEDTRAEPSTLSDGKKNSLISKGTKSQINAKKEIASQSGIPKPGQTGKPSCMGKNSVVIHGGKLEQSHGLRTGCAAFVQTCQMENKSSNSDLSLVSIKGCCSQNSSSSITQTSDTNNIQLPQIQHNHPNTATVAPFMYRSQGDMDKRSMTEEGEEKKERSDRHSRSIHTSLESLRGDDSESRRLRTVKNIADLRQNLEETMSSLRQVTHISHSTLQTTFDACITTEISTRGSLALASRSVAAAPWRPGTSGPRLQAGDAPSITHGYNSSKAEMNKGLKTESAGYVSDGDILGKSVKMDSATSGYMTDGGLSVFTRHTHKRSDKLLHCERHTDVESWDDSSSVSSEISDALDTDELNTSSSLSSYINTSSASRRDLEEQLQTDAEKRSAIGCNSTWTDDLRRPDGCSDPVIAMETSSKWCNPSDFADNSQRSLTGCKPHTISQTGSWRRGVSTHLGITCPRTKTLTATNCSTLKIHSNGKTDDAKVSEKSRFSPQMSTYESKKLASNSSPHTPTNTFGFKKASNAAIITASGAVITSGSATLGKIPKSVGFGSSRLVGKQTSIDDGYLPPSTRSNLQYRSLPRPSRSNASMGTTRGTGRAIDVSYVSKGTATLPNTKSRSLARSGANQTDREKGVFSDTESLALGPLNKASSGAQCQIGRQARGKSLDTSSPTLLRLFGGKPGTKSTPITTSDSMKNTIISNQHTTSKQTCALAAPPVSSGNTHGLLHRETLPSVKNSSSSDSMKVSVGKEETFSACPDRPGSIRIGQSDRYAHPPQSRGPEDPRDWLNCHPSSGIQDSTGSSPFSPASTLSSPSASRFNFTTIGSPTTTAQINLATARPSGNHANQDGPHDQHGESRLRNATISLVEKNRTMSSSGSYREALEEVHGSSLSLVSNASSVYSTPEEKSQSEIRKLRRELEASQEKVSTLTTQLNANAHLVAAFEQSLGNMTIRLQSLTTSAEQKDAELNEMRRTIELLKKQNTVAQPAVSDGVDTSDTQMKDSSSGSSVAASAAASDLQIHRQPSSDSVSSLTSHSSLELDGNSKKKKKNWLRSSFKQAFSKKKAPKSVSSHSDVEEIDESSVPSSPRLSYGCHSAGTSLLRHSHSNSLPLLSSFSMYGNSWGCNRALSRTSSLARISEYTDCETEAVMQLRSELRDKEMKLTDIRLEALSSAHQLDQLRESLNRMQVDMEKLKVENERLRTPSRGSCSTTTSQAPVSPSVLGLSVQLSLTESTSLDMLLEDSGDGGSRKDGHHVKVVVSLDREPEWKESSQERRQHDFLIGCIGVSSKTKWEVLDGVVRRLFKEYIIHVDPVSQLGLNTDSVLSYGIGDVQRTSEADTPELLPCGYLVGDSDTISVRLKGVKDHSEDALVFETLIPKPILQRYVSQLRDHRFIILSGPSGTGKSFLASRLAEHVVLKEGHSLNKQLITSFTADSKSSKEVKQYLCNLTEQCSCSTRTMEAPRVVIVENLHRVGSLGEIFNSLLNCQHQCCPYIIGTMHQTSSSPPTNLQLHHNFRWLLCANHTEPVKGFLGRFLRRKLLETEISSRARNGELVKIIEWIPCVWEHLNRFLETHSSSDVTIGPRLFLSCPMDVEGSQLWFTDLWNFSIMPYMLEAVREGLQLYGRKASWEDPSLWVLESYPWPPNLQQLQCPSLLRLRREDVGFDCFPREPGLQRTEITPDGVERDPLMNMLIRLKEAAHCTSSPSDDSESQQQH